MRPLILQFTGEELDIPVCQDIFARKSTARVGSPQ